MTMIGQGVKPTIARKHGAGTEAAHLVDRHRRQRSSILLRGGKRSGHIAESAQLVIGEDAVAIRDAAGTT